MHKSIALSLFAGLTSIFAGCRHTDTPSPATRPAPITTSVAFSEALRTAKQGEEIQTPYATATAIPPLPVQITPAPKQPQYLISDKPEYFRTGDGVSLQEVVQPGLVRLYVYHVPVPAVSQEPAGKRIVALIDNLGPAPLTFAMKRSAIAPIGGFYQKMARGVMETMVDDASIAGSSTRVIEKRAEIDTALSSVVDARDMLVHGWYEFTIDQPARITVAQIGAADGIDRVDTLPKLPATLPGQHASGAGRGSFPASEFQVTLSSDTPVFDTASGIHQLLIADGQRDPWMAGADALTPGEVSLNKGNYGAIYRIHLKVRSSDGRSLALLVASDRKDSKWCGATSLAMHVSGGALPAGVVRVPAEQATFGTMPAAVLIQRINFAQPGEVVDVDLIYTPPGASCLPTPILLVPIDPPVH